MNVKYFLRLMHIYDENGKCRRHTAKENMKSN